jgi:hypothetical protein
MKEKKVTLSIEEILNLKVDKKINNKILFKVIVNYINQRR